MNCERLNDENVRDAIIGGLAYLTDTFVFDQDNYSVQPDNFTVSGGYNKKHSFRIAADFRKKIGKYIVQEKHLHGNWPGFINYTPRLLKSSVKSVFIVTDYNLFTTVSTALPLFLFNDSQMTEEYRIIQQMLHQVNNSIELYKRDESNCFWPHTGKSENGIIGPVNIPGFLIDFRWNMMQILGLMKLQKYRESDILYNWLEKCYNKNENRTGNSALFNIPNDIDNTSIAFIFNHYMKKKFPATEALEGNSLELFADFTDKGRTKSDRYNLKIGKETGAFLTWLKDENQTTFSNPKKGIIPLDTNNIDLVVNSNALFALSLWGKNSIPGFNESIKLLIQSVLNNNWSNTSLYYPNKLHFTYSLSRFWRESENRNPDLEVVLKKLLLRLISEQQALKIVNPFFSEAFPCGDDGNYVYSTTLFLITLLNLGKALAESAGKSAEYDEAIENSVSFILKNRIYTKPVNKHHPRFPGLNRPVYWNSGVLYSSSIKDLAEWRSDQQFTALVLEALAKYVLNFDIEQKKFSENQIFLNYANNQLELKRLE